jgi:hypothetical protein
MINFLRITFLAGILFSKLTGLSQDSLCPMEIDTAWLHVNAPTRYQL